MGVVPKWRCKTLLHLLGSLLVITSATAYGFLFREKEKKRIEELETFCYIFRILKSEIAFKKQPLPFACKVAGGKVDSGEGEILLRIARKMEEEEGRSFALAWKEGWESYWEDCALDKEEKKRVLNFSAFSGYEDRQLQTEILEEYIQQFTKQCDQVKEELEKKQKVVLLLSSCGGILLVLLLL